MQDSVVERAVAGDVEAMNALISENQDMIFNSIYYMVGDHNAAEDLTQTVFFKALKNLKFFNNESAFSTWLYAIARNSVRNYWRDKARRKHYSFSHSENHSDGKNPQYESDAPEPWETLIAEENAGMVKETIAQMRDDYKEIIVLRDIQELPYKKVAQVLDISLGTVKSRLARARKSLKIKLKLKMGVM